MLDFGAVRLGNDGMEKQAREVTVEATRSSLTTHCNPIKQESIEELVQIKMKLDEMASKSKRISIVQLDRERDSLSVRLSQYYDRLGFVNANLGAYQKYDALIEDYLADAETGIGPDILESLQALKTRYPELGTSARHEIQEALLIQKSELESHISAIEEQLQVLKQNINMLKRTEAFKQDAVEAYQNSR